MECTLPRMAKSYLPYRLDERLLLPPDMREWLPEGHLASFVLDVVSVLDLSAIDKVYEAKDDRGRAGYDPRMMVALLVYAYCVGMPSSRKIERATVEDVAFRVLSGDQHPDHDCIAAFRKEHLSALAGLFIQVLRLCQKAGLVKLGHIAIDGTKIRANASKHKAMSYARMVEAEGRLEQEVAEPRAFAPPASGADARRALAPFPDNPPSSQAAWRRTASRGKDLAMPTTDLLVLAGHASERLERHGLVACGRRQDGVARVDFWTRDGTVYRYELSGDAATMTVDAVVATCLAMAEIDPARPPGVHLC